MTKLTLTTVGSTLTNTAATQINANNAAIVTAVENTLSRDGSTPNQMNADIDMNGNDLLNVSRANVESLFIDGEGVQSVDLATALKISNNLSDVQSVTAARSNLGLTDTATSPSSAFGKNLIDDNDATSARNTLGLGTVATHDTGTSGANVPLMDGANSWSALQTFSEIVVDPNSGVQGIRLNPSDTSSGRFFWQAPSSAWAAFTQGSTGDLLFGDGAVYGSSSGTTRVRFLAGGGLTIGGNFLSTGDVTVGNGAVSGSAASPTLNFGGSIGIYRTSTALRMTYSGVVIGEFSASGLVMANNQPISFAGTGAATTRTNLGLGTAAVLNALVGTATYDPPSLVDGAGASTTVTVTGAALGDVALASFSLSTQGITVTANVTAADTVTVRFQNETTGTIDLASGTLKAVVLK